jgi:hypothetical protein
MTREGALGREARLGIAEPEQEDREQRQQEREPAARGAEESARPLHVGDLLEEEQAVDNFATQAHAQQVQAEEPDAQRGEADEEGRRGEAEQIHTCSAPWTKSRASCGGTAWSVKMSTNCPRRDAAMSCRAWSWSR